MRPQKNEMVKSIGAGEFKAKCLALIDEVYETGNKIVVTKRGEKRVMIVPLVGIGKQENRLQSLMGCLAGMAEQKCSDGELFSPLFEGEDWDRMLDEKWERIERENLLTREKKP